MDRDNLPAGSNKARRSPIKGITPEISSPSISLINKETIETETEVEYDQFGIMKDYKTNQIAILRKKTVLFIDEIYDVKLKLTEPLTLNELSDFVLGNMA